MKVFKLVIIALIMVSCGSDDRPGYQEPYDPSDDDPVVEPLTDE